MFKKIFANKKMLVLTVAVLLILVGTLIVVLTRKDSGENKRQEIGIQTDKEKDRESSKDTSDDVSNGDGLEVQDTLDGSVYTIDGSGDWSETSGTGSQTEDNASDSQQSGDKKPDDTKKEEPDNKDSDADGALDKDILVDDKKWGPIN